MIQDFVVAVVSEEAVRDVLPAIHRAGLGHLSRLVRVGRSPVLDQLQRAGVPVSQAPGCLATSGAVLLVKAAARSAMASSLLLQHGATRVWVVSGLGRWIETEDMVIANPNAHLLPPHPAQHVPGRDPHHGVTSGHPPVAPADVPE